MLLNLLTPRPHHPDAVRGQQPDGVNEPGRGVRVDIGRAQSLWEGAELWRGPEILKKASAGLRPNRTRPPAEEMAAFVDDEYRRGDCDGSPIVLRGGATSCGWMGV